MKTMKHFVWMVVLLLSAASAMPVRAELPDFTALVERNAGSVVNISARKTGAGSSDDPSAHDGEEVPEIFRRFFGDPRDPRGAMPERVSTGSGFIISADGYVLTNHHVVDGADEVNVRLKDRREFKAKLIGSDQSSDVALLKIEASDLVPARLGSSSALKPGQWVVAIGSPFNLDYSVTAGIVSAVGRSLDNDQRYVPFIQTDVAINRGNSGGPLFNLQGEVVGINSQIFSNTGGYIGLSFAIPIEVAKSVSEQLRTKGRVSRGVLGVGIQEVNRDIADALGLPRIAGALVGSVEPGSSAEKAGVKVQDVIVGYNGTEIGRSAELPPMVGSTPPGTRATLEILRDGKRLSLPVVVGELKEGGVAAAPGEAAGTPAGNALGVAVRGLPAEEREQLELDNEGVLVEEVSGRAARRAGLQPGDVILMVGRQRVASAKAFEDAAKAVKPDQSVILLVRRGEASSFLAIRPEADQ
jgi:serine protease Do